MSTNKNILSLDKFYTNRDIVNLCYDVIKTHIDIDKNDLIIEPSAGNGSFINIIKKLSNNYKFYDIKYFYPYAWYEMERRNEDFNTTSPESYSVHHWTKSWAL